MFVNSNRISEVRAFFFEKLQTQFSANECKLICNAFLQKRLHLSKTDILLSSKETVSESDLLYFRSVVKRLLENEPFQYILGESEFYGLNLKIDSRALIPRPETEELVAWINESFPANSENLTFFDFCTGSGCIALALKSSFKNSTISASDISSDAIELARENSISCSLEVNFIQHDLLLDQFEAQEESFDCIVSNPPYIPFSDKKEMHENVLKHEPHLALFVENDNPFLFYSRISEIASKKLKVGGFLFFEIHEKYAGEIENILKSFSFRNIEIKKDLQGKNRMIKAVK